LAEATALQAACSLAFGQLNCDYIQHQTPVKSSTEALPPLKSAKVLDPLHERICCWHCSIRTQEAYVHWVRTCICFHGLRHPATLGGGEVVAFLSWLANTRNVAASTHKQALPALLLFSGKVLGVEWPGMTGRGRPLSRRRPSVVLNPDEVARMFCFLEGEHRLFAQLLDGTGLRINVGLRLRLKDLDLGRSTIDIGAGVE